MNKKPTAILFDMDGVLVDSLDSWWSALNSALKTYAKIEIGRDEFIKKYWGHDLRDNLKKVGLNPEIAQFCNTIYGEHIHAVRLYPDAKPTLNNLHHYRKGIITNTPRDCALQILKKFDINGYFQTIVTSDEVAVGKPNPEIIFMACSQLQVKPEDALIVGDTISDVKAGRAAGCSVVGLNIDADITIHRLSELPTILH